ncbi:MAG: Transposase [Parcubacteria group bacterium GW2011_GWA2_56_21]|nr:MAG: Transposase [Parcubacteria group bacterium GW2011_GWA2_56_21]
MRKEPFGVGSYVHVVQRGTRGLPIVRDEADRFRFLLMLTHFNDSFTSPNWYRDLHDAHIHKTFERPLHWPERDAYVLLSVFGLVENHFHLLLEEIKEGGIARFMHRLGTGMAKKFNERYGEKGSLFQSSYCARIVDDDNYFRYVSAYIQVKNSFDVHPKGYNWARDNFDEAYAWASTYPYSSLGDYVGTFDRPIVDKEFLASLYSPEEYREFARDVILDRNMPDDFKLHSTDSFE